MEFAFDEKHRVWLRCIEPESQHVLKAESRIVWPGASNLCRLLLLEPQLLRGKSVLELGAGPGLAGLFALTLGARRLFLTDYDLDGSLRVLHDNVARNQCNTPGSPPIATVHHLAWGDVANVEQLLLAEPEARQVEVLLASDVVYYESGISALLTTVSAFLSRLPNSIFVLANMRIRLNKLYQPFIDAAHGSGLAMRQLSLPKALERSSTAATTTTAGLDAHHCYIFLFTSAAHEHLLDAWFNHARINETLL